jgi:hypothetical protein
MPANTQPIFPLTPNVSWATVSSGNGNLDGTGTTSLVFTAGINGSRIDQILIEHLGSNTLSVVRLFVNNGQAATTASNNSLVYEVALPGNTLSQTTASALIDASLSKDGGSRTEPPIPYLPPSYRIRASVGASITAGVNITVFGGDY